MSTNRAEDTELDKRAMEAWLRHMTRSRRGFRYAVLRQLLALREDVAELKRAAGK